MTRPAVRLKGGNAAGQGRHGSDQGRPGGGSNPGGAVLRAGTVRVMGEVAIVGEEELEGTGGDPGLPGSRQWAGADTITETWETGECGPPWKVMTSVPHMLNLKYLSTKIWSLEEKAGQRH